MVSDVEKYREESHSCNTKFGTSASIEAGILEIDPLSIRVPACRPIVLISRP